MTDSITEVEDVLTEEDPRVQLQDQIAELLAELSEAADAPSGFQTCAQFAEDDVDFQSDAWMSRLADVQGWLHFGDDLPTSDAATFVANLSAALGFENEADGVDAIAHSPRLREAALERLSERVELAVRQQQVFLAALDDEGASRVSATAVWEEKWSTEEDSAEVVTPEPVAATVALWPISQLAGSDLNLTPSYQRGDVWRAGDRQALIESVLRGIPLPSIILLNTGASTPYEVVDGKQRLTAILRFIGKHPLALEKVAEADKKYPDAGLSALFESDYLKFRKAWKQVVGEPLTAKLEDEYYFPFKLRSDGRGGLVGPDLEPLHGKFFTQIKENIVKVAEQEVKVKKLFGGMPKYAMPVIEYTRASPDQIHEVFKLYNKQGMHLNAEEIRNAVYHDVELTRAILVAAGDASSRIDIAEVVPALVGVPGIKELGITLKEYGFGNSRYRRTKVLGWVVSVLLNDTEGKKELPSTAKHIDLLLDRVQGKKHPRPLPALRSESRLADLFGLLAQAVDLHAAHEELWSDKFKDGDKGAKWQELQLVGSLVGITIATAFAPDDIEDRIVAAADDIREATKAWVRPEKTQTSKQWDYIARIAQGIVEKLGVDVTAASTEIQKRFGSSGIESLLRSIQKNK
jgi:hypothetical protein